MAQSAGRIPAVWNGEGIATLLRRAQSAAEDVHGKVDTPLAGSLKVENSGIAPWSDWWGDSLDPLRIVHDNI